jgi:hypothetical protein
MELGRNWRFLTVRWWTVHFLSVAAVYTVGRIAGAILGG